MKFKKRAKFLAMENKTSKKTNNIYTVASVMVGTELLTVMSEVPILSEFGKEIDLEFELNLKYNQLKIVGVECIK